MELLIGVDIGTTNIKAAAYDGCGNLAGEASCATPSTPQGPRQASSGALELWLATAGCLAELTAKLPERADVAGVAVASVGETGVLLNAVGQPLCPIIAWYDERTVLAADASRTVLDDTAVYRATGLPPGHTYTAIKLLWLQQHYPEFIKQAVTWLAVSEWTTFCLGGEPCMGYSQASRTMALDLAQRCWWAPGLQALGLPIRFWPRLTTEGTRIGSVTTAAAHLTGLQAGTPIYLAGHDHVCGALAGGVIQPGIVLDSTGTTEAELMTVAAVVPLLDQANPSFCLGCHVVDGRYYATGGILGAGSLIGWLASILWPASELPRAEAIEALSALTAESPRGANGLYLLPHLAGAGSPDRSSTARGVIAGLSIAHTRADLARAAVEGLGYELNALWDALERFSGQAVREAVTVGGGARNTLWNQIKADITGRVLHTPAHREAVTRGAAMLAGLGAGIYVSAAQATASTAQPATIYQPDPTTRAFYGTHQRQYIDQLRPGAVQLGRISGTIITRGKDSNDA